MVFLVANSSVKTAHESVAMAQYYYPYGPMEPEYDNAMDGEDNESDDSSVYDDDTSDYDED
ncbi:hypothetical protein GGF32_003539, partial [Allomyces javanicus]